jgi:hypothetical protein
MEQMTPTPSQDIINLFRQRFVQREDCYPLQIAGNGGYTVIREPITDAVIADHLQGSKTIGLYSSPDSTTKWLCIDIDTLDETELGKVQERVSQLGIPCLTEFSGKKGFHIWVFFDKPYPNEIARTIGSYIAAGHEIFPKQDHIETGKLGNLVKAPLGIHQVTGNWCHFLDGNLKPEEDQYAVLAEVKMIDPRQFLRQQLPKIWEEIHQRETSSIKRQKNVQVIFVPVMKDCVQNAILQGAGQGERNQIGYIIACELRRLGITPVPAKIILSSVWNPQNNPPLSESEIELLLRSAFGREMYSYGCKPDGALRQRLTCVGYGACRYLSSYRRLSEENTPQKSDQPS